MLLLRTLDRVGAAKLTKSLGCFVRRITVHFGRELAASSIGNGAAELMNVHEHEERLQSSSTPTPWVDEDAGGYASRPPSPNHLTVITTTNEHDAMAGRSRTTQTIKHVPIVAPQTVCNHAMAEPASLRSASPFVPSPWMLGLQGSLANTSDRFLQKLAAAEQRHSDSTYELSHQTMGRECRQCGICGLCAIARPDALGDAPHIAPKHHFARQASPQANTASLRQSRASPPSRHRRRQSRSN